MAMAYFALLGDDRTLCLGTANCDRGNGGKALLINDCYLLNATKRTDISIAHTDMSRRHRWALG